MVSVVLPTFRRVGMLARAIDSVRYQTHRGWELVVVDDNGIGSSFQIETQAFMARYASDERITYVAHERNLGGCAARNTGIRRARAPFVAFLDDDDAWYPIKLERQLACFEGAGPGVAMVYGGVVVVDELGNRTAKPADRLAHLPDRLLKRNGIGTTSVIICRREALLAVDGFDELLPSMQDYDLYIRLAQRFSFASVEEPLLDYHRHAHAKIGKDYEAAVAANRRFYEKHHTLFEHDSDVHHHRLRSFALEVMRSGRFAEARRLLWRAWRARPSNLGTLALAASLHRPLVEAYRRVRRAHAPLVASPGAPSTDDPT